MKRVAEIPLEVISFKDKLYSTLDFCPPGADEFLNKSKNFQPLREGWELAEPVEGLKDVLVAHKWGGADWLVLHGRSYSLNGEEDRGDSRQGGDIDFEKERQKLYKGLHYLGYSRVVIVMKGKPEDPCRPFRTSYTSVMNANILKRRRFTDFVIACEGDEFPCHRAVLAEASSVFEAVVSTNMAEGQSGCLRIQDAEPESVSAMLSFIYTGKLVSNDGLDYLKLAILGDKYGLDQMIAVCAPTLLDKLDADTVGPIARVLRSGADNPCLQPFFQKLQDTIARDRRLLTAVIRSV